MTENTQMIINSIDRINEQFTLKTISKEQSFLKIKMVIKVSLNLLTESEFESLDKTFRQSIHRYQSD